MPTVTHFIPPSLYSPPHPHTAIFPEDGDQESFPSPTIDLTVTNCAFTGLSTTARGGSAIYIMRPGQVCVRACARVCVPVC